MIHKDDEGSESELVSYDNGSEAPISVLCQYGHFSRVINLGDRGAGRGVDYRWH